MRDTWPKAVMSDRSVVEHEPELDHERRVGRGEVKARAGE